MEEQWTSTPTNVFLLERLQTLPQGEQIHLEQLPFTIKILLESLLRNQQQLHVTDEELVRIALQRHNEEPIEIPFMPTRVIMQDASGVPALVDLVSLREQVLAHGVAPAEINPAIPVDLVIDHSVQVDTYGTETAFAQNLQQEYARNEERYAFLKWAQQAFDRFRVVPPANGIIHQVNLECLTQVVQESDGILHPEIVIGTDSHTTMVNALGVLGWGVGGIEAESAMLGMPVSISLPKVVGVKLVGKLREGVTATDVALTLTQQLRQHGVVGKFVEYYGEGLQSLSLPDRATIANMAPEYGATCGFFPVDEETLRFLTMTGKSKEHVARVQHYCERQGLFHTATEQARLYDEHVTFDLSTVNVSVAGPKRPQDKLALNELRQSFPKALPTATAYDETLRDGSIVIAAITSCTNTSNPVNMIGAGLLAKKAVELGLSVSPFIQTSLAPGSKAVTAYLQKAGLLPYLEQLGFYVTGYGCSVCVGNTGDLKPAVEAAIEEQDLTVASVLSGNRNFEGRIHALVKANYLMSPPLVVAFAIAGTVNIDVEQQPLGYTAEGEPVYLKDIWPSAAEISAHVQSVVSSDLFKEAYTGIDAGDANWQALHAEQTPLFTWDAQSTYFKASPFFQIEKEDGAARFEQARVLLMLGDSITTDHISPVGHIMKDSAAAAYLQSLGVAPQHFNSYGSRRGNYDVLVRGTFAHPRLHNLMLEQPGSKAMHFPTGEVANIYDVAMRYKETNTPLVILAGKEYGTGSARDWAAKGTYLLGVKMVIAESFERIHRSNLVMMGILPLQFMPGEGAAQLGLTGHEVFTLCDATPNSWLPKQHVRVEAVHPSGTRTQFTAVLRLDTRYEVDLYAAGGVFSKIVKRWSPAEQR